jgi:HlyD family secretion protein
MTPEERRKRMEERMAAMTPEERERFQQRMSQRGAGDGGGQGVGRNQGDQPSFRGDNSGGGRGGTAVASRDMNRGIRGNVAAGASVTSGATTIDSLFAPIQVVETRGRAWIYENKQLRSVPVRLGVADNTYSELLEGDLKEGQELVLNFVTGLEPVTRPGQTGTGNPLMGPQRGGPGGGGGRGGGGRGF